MMKNNNMIIFLSERCSNLYTVFYSTGGQSIRVYAPIYRSMVDSIHLFFQVPPTHCYLCNTQTLLNNNSPRPPNPENLRMRMYLHVLAHHGNHEIEQSDGLDEGEAQNGVREELGTHAGVASHGEQEGGEHESDTDTSTTETDGSRSHTNVLGDLDHGVGDLRRVGTAAHGVAGGGIEDGGCLLTLHGLEGIVADADACSIESVSHCILVLSPCQHLIWAKTRMLQVLRVVDAYQRRHAGRPGP